jgi:type II secretory pathway pseudopilin PulG
MQIVKHHRGDTIIEVLLAVTVFSLVAVGALAVMNRSLNSAQQSLEITQVKQQIDSQAAVLRAAHQSYVVNRSATAIWTSIPKSTGLSGASNTACPAIPSGAFIMNPRTGGIGPAVGAIDGSVNLPYAGVWYANNTDTTPSQAKGIWIETSKQQRAGFPDAYDFRIRACWYTLGTSVPQTIDTLVRLYEP